MDIVATTAAGLPVSLAETAQLDRYIKARHSDSTRRGYASDVLIFAAWCDAHSLCALPATPETVAYFVASEATAGKAAATIGHRLAAIRHIHRESGHLSPTDSDIVAATMSGIRRTVGVSQRQAAPATVDVLAAMLGACDDSLRGCRDRALLAIGFGGAFRRSELVNICIEHVDVTPLGLKIFLPSGKTDQDGAGESVAILDGNCLSVKSALAAWLAISGITSGPVFRRLLKGGTVLPDALTDRSVANIIKERAEQIGLDPTQFSGHSLRSGFLTSAAESGSTLSKMMDVSRHRKVDTVMGYIRSADAFKDHAGSKFM